jgi:hypothetical protein
MRRSAEPRLLFSFPFLLITPTFLTFYSSFCLFLSFPTSYYSFFSYSTFALFSSLSDLHGFYYLFTFTSPVTTTITATANDIAPYPPYFPLFLHPFRSLEIILQFSIRSRDSSVGIAKGYGLNGRGSIPGRGKTFFTP